MRRFDRAQRRGGPDSSDDRAVADSLDDAAVMGGARRVDEIAAKAPETRERSLLVVAGEPAVADDIRNQDRRELTGFTHSSGTPALRMASMSCSRRFR